MKFQLLILLQEIHTYLPMRGMSVSYNYNALLLPFEHRQRVESLILSSQISTNPRRVFLGGDTIKLTFNIGKV